MDTVDVLVMGRKTYEKVLAFGEWPYGNKPVIVLTGGVTTIPEGLTQSVEAMSCPPANWWNGFRRRGEAFVR